MSAYAVLQTFDVFWPLDGAHSGTIYFHLLKLAKQEYSFFNCPQLPLISTCSFDGFYSTEKGLIMISVAYLLTRRVHFQDETESNGLSSGLL